ncbi:hypothetical protein A2524_00570 [Candidatus Wolfebacteria bacterium RIFOXYD12_FULL_48_21]|uniref:Four helix bundle protein n=1 Tax=Candidatus Wolfebacteria bacterium RIFOXYD1_FULL_48_65 TaxID=1802561 RepID=A0A1F8E0W7_9BACT|nr:MAG: hypothetical protein A2610_00365 [Candidatus Wolfebacteria bacterium RIFOXYD1_FULL_48_65]OGM94309.1 MAG: hypothetical protein A2524_00570 [Candidatus Wolfebacteria bacterium RIFOXYD12_FULL_48_21]OGM95893.1 MAG: hypothetical protein A2532_02500 [Candidatus Wolfebacteria bacterium RIFOXYD2_FULL_48_11]
MNENAYNLEQRTREFSVQVIRFLKTLQQDTISRPIIGQLIRSATSVGANYCEANGASSKKDFCNKIFICKKEAKETHYWLDLIEECCGYKKELNHLRNECVELIRIFSKIAASSKEER